MNHNYSITIEDANDCEYQPATISLMDEQVECLRIPNAFTPDGDGVNDTWIIANIDMYPKHHIQVFNRWGQTIYEGHHGDEPWDGTTLSGKKTPVGYCIYIIELFNGTKPKSGIVTVVY